MEAKDRFVRNFWLLGGFLLIFFLAFLSCVRAGPTTDHHNSSDGSSEDEQPEQENEFLRTFRTLSNWKVYKVKVLNVTSDASQSARSVRAFTVRPNGVNSSTSDATAELEPAVHYFASGLVRDDLFTLHANSEMVFVSGLYGGYSYFRLEDVPQVRGKITTVTLSIDEDILSLYPGGHVPGVSSWAESPDGRVYALYGNKILDAVTGNIVCELDKLGIAWLDPVLGVDERYFWIGSSCLRGFCSDEVMGLFRIERTSGQKDFEHLLRGYDVFKVFRDSYGRMWVSALNGVYYYSYSTGKLLKVFGHELNDLKRHEILDLYDKGLASICDDIFECNGKIYFLMKRSGPGSENGVRTFTLSVYYADLNDLENIDCLSEATLSGIFAPFSKFSFITFRGKVYFYSHSGFSFTGDSVFDLANGVWFKSEEVFGTSLGTYANVVRRNGKEVIIAISPFDTHGFKGVKIFDPEEGPLFITQASSSEGLLSNHIGQFVYRPSLKKLFVFHGYSTGYSVLDQESKCFSAYDFGRRLGFVFEWENELYDVLFFLSKVNLETGQSYNMGFYTNGTRKISQCGQFLWGFTSRCEFGDFVWLYDLSTGELKTNDPFIMRENYATELPDTEKREILSAVQLGEDEFLLAPVCSIYAGDEPFVFKYSISENKFTKIPVPHDDWGIRVLLKDQDGTIWGVGRKTVFKLEKGHWVPVVRIPEMDLWSGTMKKFGDWLIILEEYGKLIVVDVRTLNYVYLTGRDLGIPVLTTLDFGEDEFGNKVLWLGSMNGLAMFEIEKAARE